MPEDMIQPGATALTFTVSVNAGKLPPAAIPLGLTQATLAVPVPVHDQPVPLKLAKVMFAGNESVT